MNYSMNRVRSLASRISVFGDSIDTNRLCSGCTLHLTVLVAGWSRPELSSAFLFLSSGFFFCKNDEAYNKSTETSLQRQNKNKSREHLVM